MCGAGLYPWGSWRSIYAGAQWVPFVFVVNSGLVRECLHLEKTNCFVEDPVGICHGRPHALTL
jgi:hypothetical protein